MASDTCGSEIGMSLNLFPEIIALLHLQDFNGFFFSEWWQDDQPSSGNEDFVKILHEKLDFLQTVINRLIEVRKYLKIVFFIKFDGLHQFSKIFNQGA